MKKLESEPEAVKEIVSQPKQPPLQKELMKSWAKEGNSVLSIYPAEQKSVEIDKLIPAPEKWNFFPTPPVAVFETMMNSIYNQGILSPLIVWEQDDGYMILGGHTRYSILKSLITAFPEEEERFSSVPCHIYKKDQIQEVDAQRILILDNIAQRAQNTTDIRNECAIRLSSLEKKKSFYGNGDVATKVANILGMHRSTFFRMKKLSKDLHPKLHKMMEDRKITYYSATVLSELPRELQNLIVNTKSQDKLTPRAISLLRKNRNEIHTPDDLMFILEERETKLTSFSLSCRPEEEEVMKNLIREMFERQAVLSIETVEKNLAKLQ